MVMLFYDEGTMEILKHFKVTLLNNTDLLQEANCFFYIYTTMIKFGSLCVCQLENHGPIESPCDALILNTMH